MSQLKNGKLSSRLQDFKALSRGDQLREVGNWLLDHAMIIIIVLLCVYIQIQRPAFLQTASIVNIIQLTASRLPIALGIAGAIILTGTDLSAGRIVGLSAFAAAILLQKVGVANKFLAAMGPQSIVVVIFVVLAIGAIIGVINGFCVAKFKLHPFIVTLSTQLLTYGAYLTLSNAAQISNLDESYTTGFVMKAMFKLGNTPVMSYVGYAVIVTIIMWFIWNKTTFGKNMFAVGSNEGSRPRIRRECDAHHHRRVRTGRRDLRLHRLCGGRAHGREHRHHRPELRAGRHRGVRYRRRIVRRRQSARSAGSSWACS